MTAPSSSSSSSSSYAATQFGAPLGEYRASALRIVLIVAGILSLAAAIVIGGIFGLAAMSPDSATGDLVSGVILTVLFLAAAIYCFVTVYRWRGAHAQLFERGFSIARGGKSLAGRWDDVASVTQRVIQSRYYGIPVYTSHTYALTMLDGGKIKVDNAFGKVGKLGDTIQRLSANALLPRAIAAYHSGATLPFGKLSVSQAGISNGKQTLPWSDLNQLTLRNGYVLITRKGKMLRWTSTPISATPNLYVLTALVGYIQRGVR